MKIVFFYKSLETGGIARVLANLANEFQLSGHEVVFLLRRKSGKLLEELHDEIRIIDLDCQELRHCIIPAAWTIFSEKPDFIVSGQTVYNIAIIISNYLAGHKSEVVATEHMSIRRKIENWSPVKRWLIKTILVRSDWIVVVSEGMRHEYIAELEMDRSKVRRIYNPIL